MIGQRDRLNANKYFPQQRKYLHDAKLKTFHSHPQCDSKEWNILKNYSYPKHLIRTIVMQGQSNFTFKRNILNN